MLTWLGRCPIERPWFEFGIIGRTLYFSFFIFNPYVEERWEEILTSGGSVV